jgi:REP element-mobilizing transposase RayT
MKQRQGELPFRQWGGKRKGAGRKRKGARPKVAHRPRPKFRKAALHVTMRVREEVWNLRTRRCFAALARSFEKGCDRFGVRVVHFSVQGNHIHLIVEAPDPVQLPRAMKGLAVRMARALNKVMNRKGPVFADRYHSHVLTSPREAASAVRYVLDNWIVHARREGWPLPSGVDPYCSTAWDGHDPPLVAQPLWWMLRVGVARFSRPSQAA